ncbi:MAG: gliding motility-associated ABC transporter substrate-binding protein GldG [Crocinitomicaceae bacterium]|nr:gliding motility-associated ABC transporter substrate-binding protein GldG [Crocinitomicaceae bacterium]
MAEKKKIISGFYNWTFLVIVVVAVILINIVSSFVYRRIDMTEDQRFSLAEGTQTFLENTKGLKGRVNLKIYLEGNLPSEVKHFRDAIEDKLKEFKLYAGDRIEYQFIDPHEGTDDEQEALFQTLFAEGKGILPMQVLYEKDGASNKMMLWPGAVIEYDGSTANTIQFLPGSRTDQPYRIPDINGMVPNAINNLEYMLVSSLRRATAESKKRIAFLQGHGELQFKETQRVRAMISPYFAITDIELNDSIHALDNVDGLIIARPRSEFSDKDLYIIDQFLMKGGRLMCFLDKLNLNEDSLRRNGQTHTMRYDLGLDNMLFDYGLKLQDNYVLDTECAYRIAPYAEGGRIQWFYHVLGSPTTHPISKNLENVSLPYTGEIQFVNNKEGVALTPILTSSTNSMVTGLAPVVNLMMPVNYGENPQLAADPNNPLNQKCLAGLAEGTFDSYFKNRIVGKFANDPESGFKDKSEKEGKVLLVGNGRWIANKYDSMPDNRGGFRYRPKQLNNLQRDEDMMRMRMQHFFGNQELFQNMTDYMMGENSVLDIRSRQIDMHPMDKDKVSEDATFYKIVNLLLPIGIILLLGFAMNFIRKRRYA